MRTASTPRSDPSRELVERRRLERELDARDGAVARGALDAERSSELLRALGHSEQTEASPAHRRIETDAVVGDRDREAARVAGHTHAHSLRARVARYVRERLLHDAER